ncbi:rhodanese-like domain-containing protein [Phormidium tenue FACHB-886]|nr:rhodanese-like domain-containing protein [Phormidium tenue FACHB-886]
MADLEDAIVTAKDKLPDITPTPPGFHNQATAHELKARLNWGEPGLTILDVRDRQAYLECRILGAMNVPLQDLPTAEQDMHLSPKRDLYIYGATDEEAAQAASSLRQAGFEHVAELKGGLVAWQEINGSVEGSATNTPPDGPDAYNVGARLKEFAEEKSKEQQMK